MDNRPTVTAEDIDWLRKLRNDIPTSVVRKLTQIACAEVKGPRERSNGFRDRDELDRRKQGG